MRITLVRHAEVQEHYIGKYNGHIDIGLSKNGQTQATALAKELQNEHFDAVYSSDLLRAKETLQALKLSTEPIYLKALREKSWGEHEGKSFQEITAMGIEYQNFTQWIDALGGESIESFKSRVQKFFNERIFQTNAHNILIITHSGVIKMFYSLYHKISLEEAFAQSVPYGSYESFEILFTNSS